MADVVDASMMAELGQTGLVRYSGFVFEEFLRELQGPRGMAVYREMSNNDPTAAAALFAWDQLVRAVSWRVDPYSDQQIDVQRADFVQSNIDDMTMTWTDTVSEVLTMDAFGFSFHEIVYKQRLGPNPGIDPNSDPQNPEELPASKHSDGLIGWRRLPIRAQETLWMWEFGPKGEVKAMIQRSPPHFREVRIPIEKALLFRHRSHKNNPEGVSVLRGAYRPWYFKKKIEVIEAIGVERDLAGLPVAEVPPELLGKTPTAEQAATLAAIKKIVTNIRRDEQEGVVWPLAYDAKDRPRFKLSLLSTGGRRQFDTNAIVGRYNSAIAQSVLADLILIGTGSAGSYALMESKLDLLERSIEGWLDSIAEVFNRYAIPRLLATNGMPTEHAPRLAHGSVAAPDLKDLSAYITALSGAKMITPNPADEGWAREIAHMPPPAQDEASTAVGKSSADAAADAASDAMREMYEAARELREALREMPD